MNQEQEDHLAGKHVVVTRVYGNQAQISLLDDEGDESEAAALWVDDAFTNGPPLVEIRLQWNPAEADKMRAEFARRAEEESNP